MILILDIDMTIADGSARFAAAGAEPDKADKAAYDAWLAKAQGPGMLLKDAPVVAMQELLDALGDNVPTIHYVTSRSNKHREETLYWLSDHGFPAASLWMRKDDDYRQAWEYKEEVMGTVMDGVDTNANVIFIDDDPEIAKLCQRHGWLHLQPNLKRGV